MIPTPFGQETISPYYNKLAELVGGWRPKGPKQSIAPNDIHAVSKMLEEPQGYSPQLQKPIGDTTEIMSLIQALLQSK